MSIESTTVDAPTFPTNPVSQTVTASVVPSLDHRKKLETILDNDYRMLSTIAQCVQAAIPHSDGPGSMSIYLGQECADLNYERVVFEEMREFLAAGMTFEVEEEDLEIVVDRVEDTVDDLQAQANALSSGETREPAVTREFTEGATLLKRIRPHALGIKSRAATIRLLTSNTVLAAKDRHRWDLLLGYAIRIIHQELQELEAEVAEEESRTGKQTIDAMQVQLPFLTSLMAYEAQVRRGMLQTLEVCSQL